MKPILLMAAAILGGWGAAAAQAQQTGLEALGVLSRARGAALGNQVVVLTGERGSEQPAAWRLVTRDPAFAGRFLEYVVKNGRLVSQQAVPTADAGRFATAPLVRSKLKIDSHVVFWRAHTEAKKVLVGFDAVDYELRNAEFTTTPVWVVRLVNTSGAKVGELAVSAESGNVLRRTWFDAGRQPATGRRAASAPLPNTGTTAINEKAQQAWEGTRAGWNEGKKAVKSGLRKASTTVGGWLLRAGGESPTTSQQSPTPQQSPTKPTTPTTPQTRGPATWQNGSYDSRPSTPR
ncbi:MAG: hypothetical protein ACKV19_09795 [Verrucomicrobiales bacterium]